MASPELDGLLLDHLADLDAAVTRMDALDKEILAQIDAASESWAERAGWNGLFEFYNNDWWIAPPEWRVSDSEDPDAYIGWFNLELGDTQSPSDEDNYFVTSLCGVGLTTFGLRFKQEITTKSKWRRSLKDHASKLSTTAFTIDSTPSFFLPFRLDITALANAVREEDLDAAFGPFTEALDRMLESRPHFDQVLNALREA